ncbi:hypothetical protein [Spirosoma utsteinense]|uniref:Capsule assembly Wzi family protein n=1 Tax=Spirosoma utsteinense TaxID=2585773 RepID=A0ABR6WDQ4_9BACT|nr:hypothetical protein [Spirosoma utsteinense]MBC3789221.1 hypothetical protein [Spirosoma utsteinense]MBC3794657.1 hypothetical protein [Spirosoma utsteinense]
MSAVRCLTVFWLFTTLYLHDSKGQAQSTYAPFNTDYYHLLDRLEIRNRSGLPGFHSTQKPYSRASIAALLDSQRTNPPRLSPTDRFNIAYLRADNREGPNVGRDSLPETGEPTQSVSGRSFHRLSTDAFARQWPGFAWHINPVVGLGVGQQADTTHLLTTATIGLETRGSLTNHIGFYSFFTVNQARYPRYLQEYRQRYELAGRGLVPGEGMARRNQPDQTQFYAWRGYLTTTLLKQVGVQLGRDRLVWGNGYRSLLLSETSAPYWFVKLNTWLGPFTYTNLYTLLRNTQSAPPGLSRNPPKFMVMHHMSLNLGRHLNVGAFEAIVFSRDRLDLNYLNPIILYRSVESSLGSVDNAFIGFDVKATWGGRWQAYSQVMLDEFVLRELLARKGSWTNKYALQVGLKYVDAFGLANVDLQGELNLARPFMYSHRSGQTNYVHYNQPLAHPLGSNFIEGLGIVRYQRKRLQGVGTFGLMLTGTDPPGLNYGGSILTDYRTRFRPEGNSIGDLRKTIITYADLRVSYQVWPAGFLDVQYLSRLQSSEYAPNSYSSRLVSVGLRLNLAYRNWTF